MKKARRNYYVLLLLALLFAAPGLSAYFFYIHPHWLGDSTTNKGTLLNPPVLLSHKDVRHGPAVAKWALVLWSPTHCGKQCTKQLDKLARVRLALGRHLYEVDFRLLIDEDASSMSETLLQTLRDQDIHVVTLTKRERERLPILQRHLAIFIANVDDYLVLAYQPSVKSGDIFHDIKQLL